MVCCGASAFSFTGSIHMHVPEYPEQKSINRDEQGDDERPEYDGFHEESSGRILGGSGAGASQWKSG